MRPARRGETRIPVTIVTGAYSSGKTTVINHILAHHSNQKFAIIENQVGEIAVTDTTVLVWSFTEDVCTLRHGDSPCISSAWVDHPIVVGLGTLSITTVRRDLVQALHRLLHRQRTNKLGVNAILIETSGEANPSHIIETLIFDPVLRRALRLNGVATVVDALDSMHDTFDANHAQHKLQQIALADCILLSKAEHLPSAHTDALANRLRAMAFPGIPIIRAAMGQAATDAVLHLNAYSMDSVCNKLMQANPAPSPPGIPLRHMVVTVPGDLHSLSVRVWLTQLLQQHAGAVLAIKGVLAVQGSPYKHVFTGVHLACQLGVASMGWGAEPRCSRVVITATHALDEEEVTSALHECAAKPLPLVSAPSPTEPPPPTDTASSAHVLTSRMVEHSATSYAAVEGY